MPDHRIPKYRRNMSCVYSSGFEPNCSDPIDVLAFVLCPLEVFAPSGSTDEIEAIAAVIGPAQEQAVLKWHAANKIQTQN